MISECFFFWKSDRFDAQSQATDVHRSALRRLACTDPPGWRRASISNQNCCNVCSIAPNLRAWLWLRFSSITRAFHFEHLFWLFCGIVGRADCLLRRSAPIPGKIVANCTTSCYEIVPEGRFYTSKVSIRGWSLALTVEFEDSGCKVALREQHH